MAEPLMEPVPIASVQEPVKEPKPGRGGSRAGAGRPRKRDETTGAYVHPVGGRTRTPSKRPSRATGSSKVRASLHGEIVGFLTMVNMGIAFTPFGTKHEAIPGEFEQVYIAQGISVPMPKTRVVKLGDELDDVE